MFPMSPKNNTIKKTNNSLFEDSDLYSIVGELKQAGIFDDSMLN